MENIKLGDLYLSKKESTNIIEFLAKMRNINDCKSKSSDYEYKGIKDIKDLFELSIDKDHYKPVLGKSGYNNNYAQYESKGDKI